MKQAMHFILPAMLAAFGSAHAQTTPSQPTQPQQQPRSTQQESPPSHQAPAIVPSAQAANCSGTANKAITAMKNGDFDGAAQTFAPKLKPTTGKLQQAWGALTKQYGNAKSIGGANKGQMVEGDVIVLVPMQFEKGQVGAQAACSPGGQLVLLRFGRMPDEAASKS